MNIAKFFINNVVFLLALSVSLFVGGIIAFINLNRNEDPGFKIRTASVITEAPNYSATDTDKGITRPIEEILLTMEEIEDIKSESYLGRSVIYADIFEYYKEIQPVWDRLRRKVELSKNKIYEGLNPVVNDEYGDVFGALLGVSMENADYETLYELTRNIKNDLLKLKNRGRVEIFGAQEETVYLYFKNSYLTNLKLTPNEIKNFINSINQIKNGGVIYSAFNTTEIGSNSGFMGVNDIKNRIFNLNNAPVSLDKIFEIEKTIKKPVQKMVKSNGKEALIIGISLKKDGNILNWGDEIKKEVHNLKGKYKGANIEILALQSEYVKQLTNKFANGLFESILAVILVVYLILGAKTGLITGGIIALTVVSSFFTMKLFNIGLDKISLSALIISLGILVDNSVVIAEAGVNGKEGIIEVAGRFQKALFLVSMSASLAFLPVFIANSTVGEYASNLFKVVSITLFYSWFYSVSILPYLLIKFGGENKKREFKPAQILKEKVKYALNYPKMFIMIAIIGFILSIILFNFIPKIFFPNSDRNAYEIRLTLKNEASFEKTKEAIETVEKFLNKKKNITSYSSYIGTSAPRYVLSASPEADKPNFGMILANTKNYKTVNKDIIETKDFINKNVKSAQAIVKKIPMGPPIDAPIEIRIINNDIKKLFYYKKFVTDILEKSGGIYLIKDNWGEFIPVYNIKINENNLISSDLNSNYVFDWLNTIYNGKILTYYFRENIKIPVILKAKDDNIIDWVTIYSPSKKQAIPLNQIADIKKDYTYSKILRRNNKYVLTVQAWVNSNGNANKIITSIIPKLDKIEGLEYEIGGEWEKSKKGNKSVTEKIPVAFLFIFIILIYIFNDIKKPVIIALCAILALTGANTGLFITGSNFGFMTLLGYISLAGICINNGVILLNEIKENTKEGIIKTAQERVQPVLLTCFTTIGGMLPLWIKNDPMFSTLAISMIFGLLFSVFITLFILPALFYITVNKV